MSLHVLLADDDDLRQRSIKRLFRTHKREIAWTFVTTGSDAIEALGSRVFDRLLLGIRLGDNISGIDVLAHARSQRIVTPAVVFSTRLDQATSIRAQRLGSCPLQSAFATTDLIDAVVDPPLSAYGAFATTGRNDVSFHQRCKEMKLGLFEQVLRESGGSIHAAARVLNISQQAAQYLVRLLEQRGV